MLRNRIEWQLLAVIAILLTTVWKHVSWTGKTQQLGYSGLLWS